MNTPRRILRRLFAPLLALIAALPLLAQADTGYAARDNQLYRINLASGVATLLGATGINTLAKIEALALSRDGQLYGLTNQGQLLDCDPDSGQCTALGTLNIGSTSSTIGLGFSADGQLYAGFGIYLLRIDPAQPGDRQILNNNLGVAIAGLAGGLAHGDCASGLYALGANSERGRLYCVDLDNGGALVALGSQLNPNTADGGLDANPITGQIWGITDDTAAQIYALDRLTLTVRSVQAVTLGGQPLGGFESLAVSAAAGALPVPGLGPLALFTLTLLVLGFAAMRLTPQSRTGR